MTKLCNECETVAHCLKHGCIPKQPAPAQPMAHIVGEIDHTGKVWKPVQPAPVPLMDEQMWKIWNSFGVDEMNQQEAVAFARAIEQAHGITKGQP